MTRYNEYQALYLKFDEALEVLKECGRMEDRITMTDEDADRSQLMFNALVAITEARKTIRRAQEFVKLARNRTLGHRKQR